MCPSMDFISPALDEEDFAQTHCFDKKKSVQFSIHRWTGTYVHEATFSQQNILFFTVQITMFTNDFWMFLSEKILFLKDTWMWCVFISQIWHNKLLNWRFSNFAKKSAKIYEIRIHRWTQFLSGGRFSKRFKFSFEILPCWNKKIYITAFK